MARAHTDGPRSSRRLVGVVVAAGVLVVSGVGYATASEVTSQVKHTEVFGLISSRAANDGGLNILVVGSDDRTGLSKAERKKLRVGQDEYGRRTDSMMIVHVADDGSIGVVSIPRDSYVAIPAYTAANGATIASTKQKINAAYNIGGASLAVETVEQATGVHIDHYAEINFGGFVNMVNGLGGVPICTKKPIVDEKAGLNLPAGQQTLDGAQALGYVRARYFDPSADLGRMKRQQTFLASMFKQAMSPATLLNPARLMSFLNAAAGSVTVDENFSKGDMWDLAAKMRTVNPSAISFQTIPLSDDQFEPGVGAVVRWDEAKSAELFEKLNTGAPLDETIHEPAGELVEAAPSSISVRVLNGSNVNGQGTKVIDEMRAAGYVVVGVATNAPKKTGDGTLIEYDPRYDTSLKTLQAAFPDAQVKAVNGLGKTFRITVGSDFVGIKTVNAAAPSAPAPADGEVLKTAADDPCA